MFNKIGENLRIYKIENTDSCVPAVNADILENFKKFAENLKKIAPKAEDFLYFSAVMMHAAEASSINDDGSPKKTARGEEVKSGWNTDKNTWRWESNDPNVKPYKNSNGDIFPESELIKAHKKWIGKPLCIDHKSNSVDHVRGFIVDTYYDRELKRVIALCALDKKNYPDLARKVATGYSNNVSMGVAVGRAICSECARVARTEADFCDHMKRKTCYGEINVDLNPIELSIVVNGADPKAYIKHVIAAANTLNSYVESKEKELNKVATSFSANLGMSDDNEGNKASSMAFTIQKTNFDEFKKEVEDKLEEIKKSLEVSEEIGKLQEQQESLENNADDTNHLAFNQSSGTFSMDETENSGTDFALAPPHERYASTDVEADLISELKKVTSSIEFKLNQMKQSLDKLNKTSTNKQEETMSESKEMNKQGYFQGAQGDEPTPNQPKYPKDPTNEKVRVSGDKHMQVDDMGSPEDLYPGDLEKKKMLARAEAEDRAMRRNAIVTMAKQALEQKKEAYFQGGGGVNEPSLGKPKYPADKLNESLREHSDKQMVGQKPFPGVGAIDGLHPSPSSAEVADEKKRKEMVQRASLKARFVKAANNDGTSNLGESGWEVFLGDKLLLTASVNELSGGRAGMLYDSIATKEFGTKLIEKVKVHGVDKVRALVKSAQGAPPAAPEAPVAPEAVMPVAPEMPAPEAPASEVVPQDTGKSGDPKETVQKLMEDLKDTHSKESDVISDLDEAIRALVGEQVEMGQMEEGPKEEMGATASDTSSLQILRRELNGTLISAMKESVASLNEHQQELEMISGMYDRGAINSTSNDFVGTIVEDAVNEAKSAVADGFKLMTAFVKYARGTKAIVKRAEIEAELNKLASEGDNMNAITDRGAWGITEDRLEELQRNESLFEDEPKLGGEEEEDEYLQKLLSDDSELLSDDIELVDDNDLVMDVKPGETVPVGLPLDTKVNVVQASFNSKEGRAALRAKLAADALKFSPMLQEAHPKGGFTTKLDVKPSDDLAKVEDLEEVHDAMMDLANAPPKVRKEAEAIHILVKEGKLDPADLDGLVAEGLDKDAVAYYKKYYAQVDGGSEFASELVKEHVKAQMEEELNNYKIKLGRAYELAYDMVERGLCNRERTAVSNQVDEIMKYNDDSFESLKRVVAKHAPNMRKEAWHMPQVGMIGSGEVDVTSSNDDNLVAQLSAALSKSSKKMF